MTIVVNIIAAILSVFPAKLVDDGKVLFYLRVRCMCYSVSDDWRPLVAG